MSDGFDTILKYVTEFSKYLGSIIVFLGLINLMLELRKKWFDRRHVEIYDAAIHGKSLSITLENLGSEINSIKSLYATGVGLKKDILYKVKIDPNIDLKLPSCQRKEINFEHEIVSHLWFIKLTIEFTKSGPTTMRFRYIGERLKNSPGLLRFYLERMLFKYCEDIYFKLFKDIHKATQKND